MILIFLLAVNVIVIQQIHNINKDILAINKYSGEMLNGQMEDFGLILSNQKLIHLNAASINYNNGLILKNSQSSQVHRETLQYLIREREIN
jgi:hypothetical protein